MLSRRQKEQRRPRGNFWQFLRTEKLQNPSGAHGSALDPTEHSRATAVEIQKASDLWHVTAFLNIFEICQNVSHVWNNFCHILSRHFDALIIFDLARKLQRRRNAWSRQGNAAATATHRRIDASILSCFVLVKCEDFEQGQRFHTLSNRDLCKNTWKQPDSVRLTQEAEAARQAADAKVSGDAQRVLMCCDKRSQSPWAKMIMVNTIINTMINSCWQTDEPHHHEDPWGRLNNMSCFSLATPFHRWVSAARGEDWGWEGRRSSCSCWQGFVGHFLRQPNWFQDSPSKASKEIGFQLTKWKSTDNECGSPFNHIHIYSHRVPVHSVHIWFWDSDCVTSHWRTWRHKQNERRHWLRQKRPRKRQRHATLPRIFTF